MPDHRTLYDQNPGEYEELVSREDHEENLLPALEELCPLEGALVVELGAGTGRLTRLVAPRAAGVTALDGAEAMLRFGEGLNKAAGLTRVTYDVADHRNLPAPSGEADLALAGWTLSYFATWKVPGWQDETAKALKEMFRVVKEGGMVLILETLGTGHHTPVEPTPELAAFYRFLEQDWGFHRTWIRTDYRFDSVEEAERIAGFFFGAEMADKIRANRWAILPECTGLWCRRKGESPPSAAPCL